MINWLVEKFDVTLKFKSEGVEVEAPLAWVVSEFGPDVPTCVDDLKAKDPEDVMGWHRYFDAWERQGKFM